MTRIHSVFARPLILLWLILFVGTLIQASPEDFSLVAFVFSSIAALVWATLFCLPVYLVAIVSNKFFRDTYFARIGTWLTIGVAYSLIIFLLTNFKLYSMYGFYTNYFVLNLITTPGGIEAMGISVSTWYTAALATVVGAIIFFILVNFLAIENLIPRWLSFRRVVLTSILGFFAQSLIYVYADYVNIVPVLNSADRVIWYIPITADTLLEDLGVIKTERFEDELAYAADTGSLNYFDTTLLANLNDTTPKNLNIVWLVAESWRADSLTAKGMPNTYAFANEQQWFTNHYSGGNGTRMGLFTQFYGLYGHYWFDVLRNRQSPLLIEQLKSRGYDFKAFTSSAFTYPEFDKTVFSSLTQEQLQEFSEGHGWQRDQKNVTDMVSYIESAQQPFFTFMFFESAHANYYFPDEDIIEPDYLGDFNYLTVDLEASMPQIKSRYVNATHHLDRQLARVYQVLEEKNLMDDTIVIVTGDHGEEFMENGRWGHNSTFSQQQIRVPLILHIPGMSSSAYDNMTSHLDIPATILSALGYSVPSSAHSFGRDLLAADFKRDFLVVSDWHGNTLVTPEVKIIFSLKGSAYQANTTDISDNAIDLRQKGYSYQLPLGEYLQQQNNFYH